MADGVKRQPRQSAGDLLHKLLATDGRVRIPQVEDIAAAFIGEMGGPAAFARGLFDDYSNAPVGSQQRVKILDIIMRGIKGAQQMGELTSLSEADLRRLLGDKIDEFRELNGGPAGHPAGHQAEAAAAEAPPGEGQAGGPAAGGATAAGPGGEG